MPIDAGRELAYHARLLRDRPRTEAFRAAIDATVHEGDVVLDVGTGTGVLAAFAARAGARHVYAVESGPMAVLAEDVLRANGLEDRVTVIRGHSSEITLPEPADVLVSETLWNIGFGEGLPSVARDMRARTLKPDARIVPGRVRMLVAPCSRAVRTVEIWSEPYDGVDLGALRSCATGNLHLEAIAADDLLGDGAVVAELDLTAPEIPATLAGEASWSLPPGAVVRCLAGWFDADLAAGISLANPPGSPSHWPPASLPIDPPLEGGGGLVAAVFLTHDGNEVHWRVRGEAGERTGSTFQGALIDGDWFRDRGV